jgi:tetratricopeptide (TPR) repeat protein
VVTEGSITQCLIDIRRALGDRSRSLIRTVPRRGYILDARVSQIVDGAPADAAEIDCNIRTSSDRGRLFRPRLAGLFAALGVVVLVAAWAAQELGTKSPAKELAARAAPGAPATYEQARFFYNRRAPGDLDRAVKLYDETLRLDPHFAPAWVGLAAVYRIQVADGVISKEIGARQRRFAVEQALRIDPGLAQAHVEAGKLAWDNGDEPAASNHAERAFALQSDDPIVLMHLSNLAAWSGQLDEAIVHARRVVALDPLAAVSHNHLANLLLAAGQFEEAKVEFARQGDLNPSATQELSVAIGIILILEHKFDAASALIERWPASDDKNQALAMISGATGRPAEADAAMQALKSQSTLVNAVRLAEVHAFVGDREEAFRALAATRGSATHDSWSSSPDSEWIWRLNFSPFLRPLRSDPRWKQVHGSTSEVAAR